MGIGAALPPLFKGDKSAEAEALNQQFLIIGAGAAGLMAGHTLSQYGAQYTVLEASGRHGGRLKKDETLADFPIDLGGEWIHLVGPTGPASILNELSETSTAHQHAEPWTPQTADYWDGSTLHANNSDALNWRDDWRFKSATWYDFFNVFIAPNVIPNIRYNSPVVSIDYSGSQIVVQTQGGQTYTADKLIFTAPVRVLLDGDITFQPALPAEKTSALSNVEMPPGIKVFMAFSQQFYPDYIQLPGRSTTSLADAIFFNEALGRDSSQHILGFFAVGDPALPYTTLASDVAIVQKLLELLDSMYSGAASSSFLDRAIVQNWAKEPYVRGSYSRYGGSNAQAVAAVKTVSATINNKIYFAGEAYAGARADWGFAHLAGQAGRDKAIEALLSHKVYVPLVVKP